MAGMMEYNISKIKVANTEYNIKDAQARSDIQSLQGDLAAISGSVDAVSGVTAFLGKTSTALTDRCTTSPIVVLGENGGSVVPTKGDFVILERTSGDATIGIEFLFDGTYWNELGSAGTLKSLAYKDAATGSFTPSGTVSTPTINVDVSSTETTILQMYMDAGAEMLTISEQSMDLVTDVDATATQPTFQGTAGSVSVS